VTNVIRKSSEKIKMLLHAHIGSLHLGKSFGKLPLGDIKTRERVTRVELRWKTERDMISVDKEEPKNECFYCH
jgi:hypothetical protein